VRRYRNVYRNGKTYRRYKPRSQKLISNRRSVFPVQTPLDRKHYKLDDKYNFVTEIHFNDTWDAGALQGPITGMVSNLTQVGSFFNSSSFNDRKMTFATSFSSAQIPGDDIIGQNYVFLYVSSVSVTWTVTRSDHNDDFPVDILMAPINTSQKASLGNVGGNYFVGPSHSPDENCWVNTKLLPGAKVRRLSTVTSSKPTRTMSIHIPLKKYMIPGFPDSNPTFWKTTNKGGVSAWTLLDDQHSSFLYMALHAPFDVDAFVTQDLKCCYYITAFQPRVPSQIFFGLTDNPTGPTGGATGPGGDPVYPVGPTGLTGGLY